MVTHARGLVCLSLTRERCRQLGLPPMVRDNTSAHGTNFTVSIEAAEGVTTGISAYDRAHTIRTAVRPDAAAAGPVAAGPHLPADGAARRRAQSRRPYRGRQRSGDAGGLRTGRRAGRDPQPRRQHGAAPAAGSVRARARPEDGFDRGPDPPSPRHRTHHRARRRARDRHRARPVQAAHLSRPPQPRPAFRAAARRRRMRPCPTLVRVHMQNPLADALHWRRERFRPGRGRCAAPRSRAKAAVRWSCSATSTSPTPCWPASAQQPEPTERRAAARWPNGAATAPAAQILADLGLGKLRVLGTPRRQVGLAGFGLEVVEYVEPVNRHRCKADVRLPPPSLD